MLAGESGVSLDDWEIDEQQPSDSGAAGTRALPVTLLASTFTRRDAMSALARAFDVTPEEAAALTARFLEREGVVRVLADPDAGPEHIRTRSGHVVTGHERRPALYDNRAAGCRAAHHRFRGRTDGRRNRSGRPRGG